MMGLSNIKESHVKFDTRRVSSLISQGKVESILENPELFFLAFGQTFSTLPHDKFYSAYQNKEILTITGKDHMLKDIEKCLEQIRLFFLEGFRRQSTVYILAIDIAAEIYLRPPGEEINLVGWSTNKEKISRAWFWDYIHPAMSPLADKLGARCSDVTIRDQVIRTEPYQCKTHDISTFKIEWLKE